jgi:hypothetical protein
MAMIVERLNPIGSRRTHWSKLEGFAQGAIYLPQDADGGRPLASGNRSGMPSVFLAVGGWCEVLISPEDLAQGDSAFEAAVVSNGPQL